MTVPFPKNEKPLTMIVASTELSGDELRKRRARLQAIFDKEGIREDFFIDPSSRQIEVVVEHGDWKHEHGHLDYVMGQNGYVKIGDRPFGEATGDDSYSSTHVYLQKEE